MASTQSSRRAVFRRIAQTTYYEWPAYTETSLYDRSSLGGLNEDVRTVASVWFEQETHESIEEFVCHWPLAYVEFDAHVRYTGQSWYGMKQLFRAFLLKEIHGWTHETALVEYLELQPRLSRRIGFETVPDQSTLWRSWHQRFTTDLRDCVKTAARTVLIKAENAGVAVPRKPSRKLPRRDAEENSTDERTALQLTEEFTEHVGQIVYPVFSLDRGVGCEIHENAFWDLQTYLGLRDNLAVNEGARTFRLESSRQRTPLGHNHRAHIRDFSIEQIREMYRAAIGRLIDRAVETYEFYRAGSIAIDTTEADPFTGDRTGHEDEIIGTKEETDEYAYQWATVQLVGDVVPLVLDARPVRKGDSRVEIVEDLLDSAMDLVTVDEVLMDRKFDSQHVLEAVNDRGLSYVVPKRMRMSEKAQAKRLLRRDQERYVTERKLHLGHNEWHSTTLIYRRKSNTEWTDYRQYAVFITNSPTQTIRPYSDRWDIEHGYKSIKRFMASTTSKHFGLRFFYFAFACLLYSIWRAVDLLVQVEATGHYEREPVVTAYTVLVLLQKQTGIG